MVDKHHETQEQSIKARKHQLFEADAPTVFSSGRPFKSFLRETPATPLSGLTKAILWAAGAIVALILIAALVKTFQHHSQGGPRPAAKKVSVGPAYGLDRIALARWNGRVGPESAPADLIIGATP